MTTFYGCQNEGHDCQLFAIAESDVDRWLWIDCQAPIRTWEAPMRLPECLAIYLLGTAFAIPVIRTDAL